VLPLILLANVSNFSFYRDWNLQAMFYNSKLHQVTDQLIVMRSVDRDANAQVLINQPIANFPRDSDAVFQLTGTLSSFFQLL
jgi:hypothetical protein